MLRTERYNFPFKFKIFCFVTHLNLPKGETFGLQSEQLFPLTLTFEEGRVGSGEQGLGKVK